MGKQNLASLALLVLVFKFVQKLSVWKKGEAPLPTLTEYIPTDMRKHYIQYPWFAPGS